MPRPRDPSIAHDPGSASEEAISGEETPNRHTAAVGGPPAAAMPTNGQADPAAPKSSASAPTGEAAHTAVTGRPPVTATPTTHGHADPVGPSPLLASASTGEANRLRRQFEDVFRPFNFDDSNDPTSLHNAIYRDRTPRRLPSTVWAGYHDNLNASEEFQRRAIINSVCHRVKDRMINERVGMMELRSRGIAPRPALPTSASPDQKPLSKSGPSAADAAVSEATPVVDDAGVPDSTSVSSSGITGGTNTRTEPDASDGRLLKQDALEFLNSLKPSPRRRTLSTPDRTRDFSFVLIHGHELEADEDTGISTRHSLKEGNGEAPSMQRSQLHVSMIPHPPPFYASLTSQKQQEDETVEEQPESFAEVELSPRRRTLSNPEADLTREFSLTWNYAHEPEEGEDTSNLCRIIRTIPRRHRSKEAQVNAMEETPEASVENDEAVEEEFNLEDVLNETVERLGNASIADKPPSPVNADPQPPAIEASVQRADSPSRDRSMTQKVVPKKAKSSDNSASVETVTKEVEVEVTTDTIDNIAAILGRISLFQNGAIVVDDQQSAGSEAVLEATQSSDESTDVEMSVVADERNETQEVASLIPEASLTPPNPPASIETAVRHENANEKMDVVELPRVDRPVSSMLEKATDNKPASPTNVNPVAPPIEAPVHRVDSSVRDDSVTVESVTKEVKAAIEVTPDSINDTVASLAQFNISENGVNTAVMIDHQSARSEAPLDATQSSDNTADVEMSAIVDKRGNQKTVSSSRDASLQPQNPPASPVSVKQAIRGHDNAEKKMEVDESQRQQIEYSVSPELKKADGSVNPVYQRQHRPLITRRQSQTSLVSRLTSGQHQQQPSGSDAVLQPRRSNPESTSKVESEPNREVVAAPSASSPQQREQPDSPKSTSTQKDQKRRSNPKDGAKGRKSITRQSRKVDATPNALVSMPPAKSASQPIKEKTTIDEVIEMVGLKPSNEASSRKEVVKPETRRPETPPSKKVEHAKVPTPSERPSSSKTPSRSAKVPLKRRTVRRSGETKEEPNQKPPRRSDANKPTTSKSRKSANKTAKIAETSPKQPIPAAVPEGNDPSQPIPKSDRQSRMFMVSRFPRSKPSPRKNAPKKLKFSYISLDQRGRTRLNTRPSKKSPKKPSQQPTSVHEKRTDAPATLVAQPKSSKPVKSPQSPSIEPKKAPTKATPAKTKLQPRLRTEVWNYLIKSGRLQFPKPQPPADESLPISANDLSNARRKREAAECEAEAVTSEASLDSSIVNAVNSGKESPVKSPEKPGTTAKKPSSSVLPPSKAIKTAGKVAKGDPNRKPLRRSEASKSTIRKSPKSAHKTAKIAEASPKQRIPAAVPEGNDPSQPIPKSDRQSRMFMVSRFPRSKPSPRKNAPKKLKFSYISLDQRGRTRLNTRRSKKSPKQPSQQPTSVHGKCTDAPATPVAQPKSSKPVKSPQPTSKELKKASTKATPATTRLQPRLRTEVWSYLLNSGLLSFPKPQPPANESLPISANDLSNARRKREAAECEADAMTSEASPDSSIVDDVNSGKESPVKSPEKAKTTPKKPSPSALPPSEATKDTEDTAKAKPSSPPKRKRSSGSDTDKAPVRRPRLSVPTSATDDKPKQDEPAKADDPEKPTETVNETDDSKAPSESGKGNTTVKPVEAPAQQPPAEVHIADGPRDANGQMSAGEDDVNAIPKGRSVEEPQEEPAEAREPANALPEDRAMDESFDVPPPDDLDRMSDSDVTIDLESSEVGSVNGSGASEARSLIDFEASESGSDEDGSDRSESPGPSTRPPKKRKAAPSSNDEPAARRRPPQTDSDSDEAPPPRSYNRRARQPRDTPTFGRLEHIRDIEGADLPNAPPVIVRQREVIDDVRLTADQQAEVLRGNDVTVARYESGAVVMQGHFNGGSTASQLLRDARRQPVVLINNPEDRIVQMALGNEHLVMRSITGDIYTVGRATEGQLGVARHRFYRQSSVTPETMRRIVLDEDGRDVYFTDIRAEGNVTIAITRDKTEYRCGGRFGPLLTKQRRQ